MEALVFAYCSVRATQGLMADLWLCGKKEGTASLVIERCACHVRGTCGFVKAREGGRNSGFLRKTARRGEREIPHSPLVWSMSNRE